ncbi:septation protein SepH [Occultella kanbiaonis]|uniref:septation protein SepH n=1 Tax=Occultella kanbiaonis TaxID=2675754 RepID=UPI0013D1A970|nr:septation protein SepH [Occultella kanbiaonis]
MVELELVGIHADGEHLILIGPDGERHRLPIDDALRAAVRRDRPQLEKLRSDSALRPRDIQILIRAGASAEDIAGESGLAIEQIRRYEGPVIAEREHVARRARMLTIGRESGAPQLGDLVVDRLAARGVDAESIDWDARRRGSEPWELVARFIAGDRDREAVWQVDLASSMVTALDDESRWLSETDLSAPGPRRHLSAVRGARLYDVETDADIAPSLQAVDAVIRDSRPVAADHDEPASPEEPDSDDESGTEALLDHLSASRGVRQPVELDDETAEDEPRDGPDGAGRVGERPGVAGDGVHEPMLWDDPPAAHPPASHPEEAQDAGIIDLPPHLANPATDPAGDPTPGDDEEPSEPAAPARSKRPRRNRRTSVPSWDEIVFGAKND